MAKLVRPCTSLTRRKQLSITKECPKEVFQELMAGLPLESEENGVEGLKRDAQGLLEPTKAPPHGRLRHFKYTLARASHRELLWRLQDFDGRDPNVRRRGRAPQNGPVPYKRGLGCARLFLSKAAGRRGQKSRTLACERHSVCVRALVCARVGFVCGQLATR